MSDEFTIQMTLPDMVRGDNVTLPFQFYDENGAELDVGGDSLIFTMKSSLELDDNSAELQMGVTISSNATTAQGIVDLGISLSSVAPGKYHFDLQWKRIASGTGEVHTPYMGTVNVLQDATLQ